MQMHALYCIITTGRMCVRGKYIHFNLEEMIYQLFWYNKRIININLNLITSIYYQIQSFLYSFFITQMYLLPRRQATLTIMALLQPQLLLLLPITTIITTSIHL